MQEPEILSPLMLKVVKGELKKQQQLIAGYYPK